jgi:hypothetical protein
VNAPGPRRGRWARRWMFCKRWMSSLRQLRGK